MTVIACGTSRSSDGVFVAEELSRRIYPELVELLPFTMTGFSRGAIEVSIVGFAAVSRAAPCRATVSRKTVSRGNVGVGEGGDWAPAFAVATRIRSAAARIWTVVSMDWLDRGDGFRRQTSNTG
jgi:hypothetical protein